ncbi:MAG: hypothetical protein QM775_34560 [Pirellulales bacterium]
MPGSTARESCPRRRLRARSTPRTASEVKPLRLDAKTLGHPYFEIDGAASDELADLYSGPLFFQAIAAEPTEDAAAKVVAAETARIIASRERSTRTPVPNRSRPAPPQTKTRRRNLRRRRFRWYGWVGWSRPWRWVRT